VALDRPAVASDQILRNGQAQPRPLGPTRDHGIEDLLGEFARDAGAVVDDVDPDDQAVAMVADGELALRTRGQNDLRRMAALRLGQHRLDGVAHDVEDGLDQLVRVGPEQRQTGVVIAAHADARMTFGRHQRADAFHDFMDVDLDHARQAIGAEQGIDQLLQPVGLGHDHPRVVAQLGIVDLGVQQLGGAAEATERILDLMCQSAHDGPARLLLGQQIFFPGDPQMAVLLVEFEHQGTRTVHEPDRRHHAVDHDRGGLDHGLEIQVHLAFGVGRLAAQRLEQTFSQTFPLRHQRVQRGVHQAPGAGAEQHFGGAVEVADTQCAVQDQHRARQLVQQRRGAQSRRDESLIIS